MDNNTDKKPITGNPLKENPRKPLDRQDKPRQGEGAEDTRERNTEGAAANRRRRNRHRNKNRGRRELTPEGTETVITNTPEEESASQPAPAEVSRSSEQSGEEGRERRNNRRRNRNRKKQLSEETEAETIPLTAADEDENPPIPEEEEDMVPDSLCEPIERKTESEEKEPKKPLYTVTGIRFRPGGKIYYFDPGDWTCNEQDHVIVETARGLEFGVVALSNRQVSEKDVVLPLRRVVRFATEEDERRHEENLEKETEAYNLCLSRIEARCLDMKLVDVEYAFDNSKLLFCYTAEGRVDFRELVKDLASVFRTRIEMRQIGIRDEAKLMGGLGVCGRPFCCKSFLPDFVQVSIKMAKEQNLSLNSAKISGACGRLMCCLRYEYETYMEEAAITPKVDAIVETPDGEGIVTEASPLKGIVKVALNKEPTASHIYRREDVTVKGYAKKRKNNDGDSKKAEEKK